MSTATITIPNMQVQLTVDLVVEALQQFDPTERAQVAKALAQAELDAELAQLIDELYSQSAVTDISDRDILAEVEVVRQQNR